MELLLRYILLADDFTTGPWMKTRTVAGIRENNVSMKVIERIGLKKQARLRSDRSYVGGQGEVANALSMHSYTCHLRERLGERLWVDGNTCSMNARVVSLATNSSDLVGSKSWRHGHSLNSLRHIRVHWQQVSSAKCHHIRHDHTLP